MLSLSSNNSDITKGDITFYCWWCGREASHTHTVSLNWGNKLKWGGDYEICQECIDAFIEQLHDVQESITERMKNKK